MTAFDHVEWGITCVYGMASCTAVMISYFSCVHYDIKSNFYSIVDNTEFWEQQVFARWQNEMAWAVSVCSLEFNDRK